MRSVLFFAACLIVTSCAGTSNDHNEVGSNSNAGQLTTDHSTTDHGLNASSPGAANAPVALQFIDTMIVHHQGAVDMSKLAETRAAAPELTKFAAAVIADQEREIAELKRWRKDWFDDDAPAINMEMPGMKMSVSHGADVDLTRLSGKDFDLEYVRQMIPHHEGAIEMSKAFLSNPKAASKIELKKLADSIIKAQEGEIVLLKEWQSKWAK